MLPIEIEQIEQMRKFEAQPEKILDFSGMLMGMAILVILFGAALVTVQCLDYKAAHSMPSAAFRQAMPYENPIR